MTGIIVVNLFVVLSILLAGYGAVNSFHSVRESCDGDHFLMRVVSVPIFLGLVLVTVAMVSVIVVMDVSLLLG